jgi:hypothetical protein
MTISAIDRSLATSIAAPVAKSPSPATSSGVSATAATQNPAPQISGPGQLFSRLQQLAQQDPAKFKEVTQHISDEIRKTAGQSSGKASDFENALADRFEAAAQSGDLSSFKPPAAGDGAKQAHHHRHPHGGDGPLASIFAGALDEVNQALSASAPTAPEPTPAPDATPATDLPSAT